MLAMVRSVRRRFRQEFFRISGRYRMIKLILRFPQGQSSASIGECPKITGEKARQ
jgi:hypothetical protein